MTRPVERVLFLARRFPPSVGGAQMHAHKLYENLTNLVTVRLVALVRSRLIHLAWWMPWALVCALLDLIFNRVDVVYFSDGVTAALATVLRPLTRARFVTSVYGLELIYGNPVFRVLMRWGIARCEKICVISQETRRLAEEAGIPAEKIRVVYLGVETPEMSEDRCRELRASFEANHGVRFGRDRVLLNIGRQVRRKGVAAFIEKGAPLLEQDVRMFIGGTGPDHDRIRELIQEKELEGRFEALGFVDDETAAMLRRSCDLYLMPNVHTPNDVEGYGIAPLEAMSDGLPVVAFAVDALVESMREGGWLIEAEDYGAFVAKVHEILESTWEERERMRKEARDYVLREYPWEKTAREYVAVFEEEGN